MLQYDAAILVQVAKKALRPVIRPGIPSGTRQMSIDMCAHQCIGLRTLMEWTWQQNPDARPRYVLLVL